MNFGHNNVGGRPIDDKPVCSVRSIEELIDANAKFGHHHVSSNQAKIRELPSGTRSAGADDTRRLINVDSLLAPCGQWTEGKYYRIEAELPGDKVLVEDDRGIKMIVLDWGFRSV